MHLMLATQDSDQNSYVAYQRYNDKRMLTATYGPSSSLLVASLNPQWNLQPRHWEPPEYENRKIFVYGNFGLRRETGFRYEDRLKADQQLNDYQGEKIIARADAHGSFDSLLKSIFVICFSGDLPFQKRFFDVLASGAIPVVVARETPGFGVSYWQGNGLFREITERYTVDRFPLVTRMFPDVGLDYKELVVEVSPETLQGGKLMEFLESISEEEIKRKLALIERHRALFLYDFSGDGPDAFTVMLRTVQNKLGRS